MHSLVFSHWNSVIESHGRLVAGFGALVVIGFGAGLLHCAPGKHNLSVGSASQRDCISGMHAAPLTQIPRLQVA